MNNRFKSTERFANPWFLMLEFEKSIVFP